MMPSRIGSCLTPASISSRPFAPLDSIDRPRPSLPMERPLRRMMLHLASVLLLLHHRHRHRQRYGHRPRRKRIPFDDRPHDGPPTEIALIGLRDHPGRSPCTIASRSSSPVRPTRLVRGSCPACRRRHHRPRASECLQPGPDRVRIDRRPCRRRVTLVRKPSRRHHHPRFLDRRRCPR